MNIRYVIFDASLIPIEMVKGLPLFIALELAEAAVENQLKEKGGLYTILTMYLND